MTDYYEISVDWHPTAYLQWNNGVLEQKFRRRKTECLLYGSVYRNVHSIEYEWRSVPNAALPVDPYVLP